MGCGASSNKTVVSRRPDSQQPVNSEPKVFSNRYKKGKELGKGGFSVVYEVIDKTTKKRHAAKEIIKASLKPEDEIGLKQEIDILQSLNHPHIVKFVDFFDEKDHYYVVLELLEGGELFDRIVQKACYNEKEARDLVRVLLGALKYIHDLGVVHRDLKPENLLMADAVNDSNVKLADFGFAKRAEGFTLTTQCGSPGYVAPEILNAVKYGKPSDMWSAGVICYILLGGYPPFHDDRDQRALFRKIKKGQYEFHVEYWAHVSDEAKDLIRGLLTVDMMERLTVDQALNHPWLARADADLMGRSLDANLKEFKKFHATRKFRAVAKAVIAIRRMSKAFGNTDSGASTPTEYNPEADGMKPELSSNAVSALEE